MHGDLASFEQLLKLLEGIDFFYLVKEGKPVYLVFLGDYVDRGDYSIKVLTGVLLLKQLFPENVLILRGNHETKEICFSNDFFGELQDKYKKQRHLVFGAALKLFELLPVMALSPDGTMAVHGGPPFFPAQQTGPRTLGDLLGGEVADLLWSDPSRIFPSYMCNSIGPVYLQPKPDSTQAFSDDMIRAIKDNDKYPVLFNLVDVYDELRSTAQQDSDAKFRKALPGVITKHLSPTVLDTFNVSYDQTLVTTDAFFTKLLLVSNQSGSPLTAVGHPTEYILNRKMLSFGSTNQCELITIASTTKFCTPTVAVWDKRYNLETIDILPLTLSQDWFNCDVGGQRKWCVGEIGIAGDNLEIVALFLIFRIIRAMLFNPTINDRYARYLESRIQGVHPFDALLPEELKFLVVQYKYPRIFWNIGKKYFHQLYLQKLKPEVLSGFFPQLFVEFLRDYKERTKDFCHTKQRNPNDLVAIDDILELKS